MNREAFEKLAEIIAPKIYVNMRHWRSCAGGIACTHPWFNERGLTMAAYSVLGVERPGIRVPAYKELRCSEAIRGFFELEDLVNQSHLIFDATTYESKTWNGVKVKTDLVPSLMVVGRINRLLSTYTLEETFE